MQKQISASTRTTTPQGTEAAVKTDNMWAQGNKDNRNGVKTQGFHLRNKAEAQMGNTQKEQEVFHSPPIQTFHTHRHIVPLDIKG